MTTSVATVNNTKPAGDPALLTLEDMIKELESGTNRSGLICPWCGGGNSKERSFSITRTAFAGMYMCHRASCGKQGRISSIAKDSLDSDGRTIIPVKHAMGNYFKTLRALSMEEEGELEERYSISPATLRAFDIRWAPDEPTVTNTGRLHIPLRNAQNSIWGCVLRALDGKTKPKSQTLLYDGTNTPNQLDRLAFFTSWRTSRAVFIVEDPLSALRLSQYVSAVALLGTHMSVDTLNALKRQQRYGEVERFILCLDRDATQKAIEMAVKNASVIPMSVALLDRDVKDMGDKEFKRFLLSNVPTALARDDLISSQPPYSAD